VHDHGGPRISGISIFVPVFQKFERDSSCGSDHDVLDVSGLWKELHVFNSMEIFEVMSQKLVSLEKVYLWGSLDLRRAWYFGDSKI
jgi:hypothetical protein